MEVERGVLLPHPALHVIGVQRARRVGADLAREHRLVVAQPIDPERRSRSDRGMEVDVLVRSVLAGMAACAGPGEDVVPLLHGAVEELLIERDLEVARIGMAARAPQIGRARAEEERLDVVQPVLDRPEARAVAPALADVERRLAIVALGGIDRAQVGDVVHPALLGAGADVEIDPLDRLVDADRVLAALEDVRHELGLLAALPALPLPARLAPAGGLVGVRRAAPAMRHFRIRCSCTGRLATLMIAFIVPGFEARSMGSAEVSTMPGRARAISCHSRRRGDMPEPSMLETRLYWLPTSPSMLSQLGWFGSAGGCSGS